MSTFFRTNRLFVLMVLILFTAGCAIFAPSPTPADTPQSTGTATPTPGLPANGNNAGGNGNNGGSSSSSNNSGNNNNNSNSNKPNSNENTATPTLPTSPFIGPYLVKQIQSLGGEVISGYACKLTQPFTVTAAAPKATFVFLFAPQDEQKGKVAYQYSIPSAGESHDAAGTYSVSPLGSDGTMQVSLSVSDHVVFKGFDGNIPNKYKFNLVPGSNPACPDTQ